MSIATLPDTMQPQNPSVLFAYGFRPFFLLGGIQAVATIVLWVLAATGMFDAGSLHSQWHAHEMLFGFAATAIAGFLLTAVPNWTATRACKGTPLMILAGLWLAGRLAVFPPLGVPALPAALIDLAFIPALAWAVGGPLIQARKLRNLPFLGMLALMFVANLLVHLEWLGVTASAALGQTLAIDMVLLMIAVVGGRIVPLFTANALRLQGIDVPLTAQTRLDMAALGALAVMAILDLTVPGGMAAGVAALAAAVLHGARLARWHGEKTLHAPILWVLHLGYLWLPVGLALKGLWLTAELPFAAGWLHAITVGAIATMILGVTTRVALGHTGRPLIVARPIAAAYLLLTGAALLRVAGPMLDGTAYMVATGGAGVLWAAAFTLFLWIYAPILTTPRPDGRPG